MADFPNIPDYRKKLEFAYNNLAMLLRSTARPGEAEAAYRQAIGLAEALMAESPGTPDLRADLIRNLGNFGNFLQEIGQHREAEATLRRAVNLAERLVADYPKVPEYRVVFLALNLYNLADLLRSNNRVPEGEAVYTRALEVLDAVPAPAADVMLGRLIRGGALGHLGQARLERKEFAEAARLLDRALDSGRAALELCSPQLRAAEHGRRVRSRPVPSQTRPRRKGRFGRRRSGPRRRRHTPRRWRAAKVFRPGRRPPRPLHPAAGDPVREREYYDRAVAMLGMAVAKGFKDVDSLARTATSPRSCPPQLSSS